MKRFLNEIKKISNNPGINQTIFEAAEIAVVNKSEITKKVVSASNDIILEKKKKSNTLAIKNSELDKESDLTKNSNTTVRQKKTFDQKHQDNEIIEFLIREDNSYYTKDVITESKDNIFLELTALRTILSDEKLLRNPIILSKEIALFYSADVSHNGENRGKVYNKKCEMFSDKFKENEGPFIFANLSAETLSNPIKIPSMTTKNPTVVLHSKLKNPNCDSYKNAHEIVVAKKIAAATGNDVFVSGDCDENDPELVSWIGDLPIKKYDANKVGQTNKDLYQKVITKKGTLKVIRSGEIKHRAAPKIEDNKQLGETDKPYDMYVTTGTSTSDSKKKIIDTVSSNLLKSKFEEYAKLLQDPNTPEEKFISLNKEISDVTKYQTTQELESLNLVENAYKVVFNTHKIQLQVPSDENTLTHILYDDN